MILQTMGPISMSDIATEFCPFTSVFTFVSGTGTEGTTIHNGIRTALPIPSGPFGTWVSPLPIVSLGGTEGNVTTPQLFSDGMTYSCGSTSYSTTPIGGFSGGGGTINSLGISLSRWNGTSFDLASSSWIPFNDIIINGPSWPNITFSLINMLLSFQGHEFIAITTGTLSQTPFVPGATYTATFT